MPHGRPAWRAYNRAVIRASLTVAALVALLASSQTAHACATCGAGDPSAQIAGAEQPFAGRVRLVGVVLHTSYTDSSGAVFDQRALVGGSIAIDDVALIAASLPLVWRESFDASLAHDTSFGLGDLDLRVRVTLARDRRFAPQHRLLLDVGSRMPTAPLLRRDDGSIAPLASQTGTGAFEPLLGLSWLGTMDEIQLSLGVQGAFPTTGFAGWRNGPALRSSASLQWQAVAELALRATLDARFEGASGREQDLSGESFVLHAGGGVVVAPSSDLVLHLVVRVPTLQVFDAMHRTRSDGVTVEAGFGLDV